MLVLTRKVTERIRIGANIWLEIVSINGNRVRLGIKAPKDVKVIRDELTQDTKSPPAPVGGAPTATLSSAVA